MTADISPWPHICHQLFLKEVGISAEVVADVVGSGVVGSDRISVEVADVVGSSCSPVRPPEETDNPDSRILLLAFLGFDAAVEPVVFYCRLLDLSPTLHTILSCIFTGNKSAESLFM